MTTTTTTTPAAAAAADRLSLVACRMSKVELGLGMQLALKLLGLKHEAGPEAAGPGAGTGPEAGSEAKAGPGLALAVATCKKPYKTNAFSTKMVSGTPNTL